MICFGYTRSCPCIYKEEVAKPMQEWNVVVSVNEGGFKQACKILGDFGLIKRTNFFNVLTMKVDDIHRMLETLREKTLENPGFLSFLSRLIPVTSTFTFQTPGEFEDKAKEAILEWAPRLAGKSFHVRMHRRGFKSKLSGLEEEQFLDNITLEALRKMGAEGRITFENPDVIIAVETIAQWAGLSLWTSEDLQRYSFIRLN